MRDINRIYEICDELKEIWSHYPDLRLGQLLLNVVRDPALYYIEDHELMQKLYQFYEYQENN